MAVSNNDIDTAVNFLRNSRVGDLRKIFPDLTQQVALEILERASMVLDLSIGLMLDED
jgi:hypothetical protein